MSTTTAYTYLDARQQATRNANDAGEPWFTIKTEHGHSVCNLRFVQEHGVPIGMKTDHAHPSYPNHWTLGARITWMQENTCESR
jgi:hypothetical protein